MLKYISVRRIAVVAFIIGILIIALPYFLASDPMVEADNFAKANMISPSPISKSTATQSLNPQITSSQSSNIKSPIPQSTASLLDKVADSKSDYDGLHKMYPFLSAFPDDIEQIIVVKSEKTTDVNVVIEAFQKADGKQWKLFKSTKGVIGERGMSSDRREGDATTPMGIFDVPFVFGSAENPGTLLEYRKTKPGDLWVSNPFNEEEYNVLVQYEGDNAKERFTEYEDLFAISLYKYSAVLDFNYGKLKVQGRGSAIFLHIAPPNGNGTSGCIGVQEADLVALLRWMDPSKNPKIVIGTEGFLSSFERPVTVKEIEGFVKLDELDRNILIEMRYATTNNFTGKVIYTYNVGILRRATAIKLAKANLELREKGLRLKVWDAYRPIYVQKLFWDIVKDSRFVANPQTGPSRHNTGCAVDVTLVDKSGAELIMPSKFDDFTEKAYRNNPTMDEMARKNMDILTNVMVKYGFKTIDSEWWHFEDVDSDKYQVLDIDPEGFK